jgi:hypothetical protein
MIRTIRIYLFKKSFLELFNIKNTIETSKFEDFTKLMLNKNFIVLINNFILKMNKVCSINITAKQLSILFLISNFCDDFIPKNDRTILDNIIIQNSKKFYNIEKFDCLKIFLYLTKYCYVFNHWIEHDKNKLIQSMIISFHFKQTHIKQIKPNNQQNKDLIKELNKQKNEILKLIKKTDKNFDIDYLISNHDQLIQQYFEGYQNIESKITNTFRKAFIDKINCSDNIDIYINEIINKINLNLNNFISNTEKINLIISHLLTICDDIEIKQIKIIFDKTLEKNLWNEKKGEIIFLLNDKIDKILS